MFVQPHRLNRSLPRLGGMQLKSPLRPHYMISLNEVLKSDKEILLKNIYNQMVLRNPSAPLAASPFQEIAAALQPSMAGSRVPANVDRSRRSSLLSVAPVSDGGATAAPGTPIPDLIRRSRQTRRDSTGRLRQLVDEAELWIWT